MTVYFVATPIGNLSDLSARAVETIKSADLVISEDTRVSIKILNHLGIKKRLLSIHEHSSREKLASAVAEIKNTKKTVYLSDAGTPNLSDPGGKLAQILMEEGIKIVPIPGPSALTALISVAPFACNQFTFLSFFPKKKGRQTLIAELKTAKQPYFFFESPHRITKTLELLKAELPEHFILIGRELSKVFEETIYCPLADLEVNKVVAKGEFVFAVVAPK